MMILVMGERMEVRVHVVLEGGSGDLVLVLDPATKKTIQEILNHVHVIGTAAAINEANTARSTRKRAAVDITIVIKATAVAAVEVEVQARADLDHVNEVVIRKIERNITPRIERNEVTNTSNIRRVVRSTRRNHIVVNDHMNFRKMIANTTTEMMIQQQQHLIHPRHYLTMNVKFSKRALINKAVAHPQQPPGEQVAVAVVQPTLENTA